MARTKAYNLLEVGNWRELQPVDKHDIYIIKEDSKQSFMVMNIIIVLLIIAVCVVGYKFWRAKNN